MNKTLACIRAFTATLERSEFYDFYALMTALASPAFGDNLYVNGKFIDLKKIVRRLRITVMYPRFNVDYATAYTRDEALQDRHTLLQAYSHLHTVGEQQATAKVIKALTVVIDGLE